MTYNLSFFEILVKSLFFNSLGVFSERSGNYTFDPDFMFLEPFNLSNPAEHE